MKHGTWYQALARKAGALTVGIGMVVAVATLGSMPVFAAGHSHSQSHSQSAFELTHFSATPVNGKSLTYKLTVTVEQVHHDGSDGGATHDFPPSIYIDVTNASGKVHGPYKANLTPTSTPGITYTSGDHNHPPSATAKYKLTLPRTFGTNDTVSIHPAAPNKNSSKAKYTFRMGPPKDPSWPDDVVSGTTGYTIPFGQLPEVPYAVGLPLVGGGVGVLMLAKRRRRTL